MHQTNQRGHNETSTATTQNQLAYKACRRWREVSARPDRQRLACECHGEIRNGAARCL
jgi:hypothetical protein